jgi:D-sedoheptulose 7-phosphate isomerase
MNIQDSRSYTRELSKTLESGDWSSVDQLIDQLIKIREEGRQVFLCGNGGSAANALHIANDFLYGASNDTKRGVRVEALSANSSILTCLGNDLAYADVFSEQLAVKGNPGDMLLVLSGSGNSANIIKAVQVANNLGLITAGILGFEGGKCKKLLKLPVHFAINDMQISEDIQLVVGHICMKRLARNL